MRNDKEVVEDITAQCVELIKQHAPELLAGYNWKTFELTVEVKAQQVRHKYASWAHERTLIK